MNYQRLLGDLVGVMWAIVLTGCTTPTNTPIVLATSYPTLTPTQEMLLPTQITIVTTRLAPTPVKATSEEGVIFNKTYGGTTTDNTGRFITSTRDGGYLVTGGVSYGCWVLKLDASGEKDWEASFDQVLHQELQLHNGFSCLLARQTPKDGYVIMGQEYDLYSGIFQKSFFMMTLNQDGNWVSGQAIAKKAGKIPYLDQDGNFIPLTAMGTSGRVTETLDGGYIVVSEYPDESSESRTHMTKTDKNGNYVWDRNLCLDDNIEHAEEKKIVCSHNSYIYLWDVIQLHDGSFVVAGVSNGVWLLKTDINGNVEWIRSYSQGYGCSLIQLSDGGFLISAYLPGDGLLIKTDSEGNKQWSKTFAGTSNYDGFMGIEQGLDGKIIIIGQTRSSAGWNGLWLVGLESTMLK
jgi:hypothetical protein